MTQRSITLGLAGLSAALATPALAHTGSGDAHGLVHGLAHPFAGLDHVLAMAAVGLLAVRIGGRALPLLPAAFVAVMVGGGALGAAGVALPLVETAIALSVVAFGLAVAFGARLPTLAAAALVGAFALFHGHAHGAEMPAAASGLAYGLGFVTATVALHAIGIALGLAFTTVKPAASRWAGLATAVAGVALLVG